MMKVKYGILKKFNKLSGFQVNYLCDLVATRTRPSFKRAMKLEKITGVHHDLWLGGTADEIKSELNNLEI